ncbi:MAG: hypothetical protein KF861_05615 [Planctomycetaceae bacterium]|nr:hypothetical protein [Planctomycetaceae bacterium]
MNLRHRLLSFCFLVVFAACGSAVTAGGLDLSRAVVLSPQGDEVPLPQRTAARMLVEEVEKRTQRRWPIVSEVPDRQTPVIVLGTPEQLARIKTPAPIVLAQDLPAESFSITVAAQGLPPTVTCLGADSRGVLFAAGRLLREMRMTDGKVELDESFNLTSAPQTPLRGHQLGYRPKTNSYDAWNVAQWEQYIRELAVFGSNAVELIPPRSDDDDESPHFPLPKIDMMVEMSRICDEYDQDVWIWYPAMDEDYADPATVEFALKEWADVFKRLPRIDAVFVPGGDPGHTHPKPLMALLEKQAASLKTFHPEAEMWMSPQSFNDEWTEIFLTDLNREQPDWLTGIVFGPQVWVPLPKLREAIPSKYPIRRYPDITHSRHCQYPVPDWDLAYALTIGREGINPRPIDQAAIYRRYDEYAYGFLTYSEGCNDDFNKIVWSMLGWDVDTPVIDIVRQYSRFFIGPEYEEGFAQGLLALERNWRGPLLTNQGVYTTLAQFQDLERTASPALLKNWRFQQALYRAYYDAYIRSRLIFETALEEAAMQALRGARESGSLAAIDKADGLLQQAVHSPPSADWRAHVVELADALYGSIRMQLSVARHKAIATERGANLDMIDAPLNNRPWLQKRFAAIRALDDENARLAEIDKIVRWTDPGPGGFYDDLGDPMRQPHLVRGPGATLDPQHFESSLLGTSVRNGILSTNPISWWHHAESMHNAPLTMQYDDLDPTAAYRIRVSYLGDMPPIKIRLTADDEHEIHPLIDKSRPEPLFEFDIPRAATADGKLTLRWYREPGHGGNGRGSQVSEIWLMRK